MKRLARSFGCPTELALELLGGKWKTVILARLKGGPQRYGELRRKIPRLSDKMLTQCLQGLQTLLQSQGAFQERRQRCFL